MREADNQPACKSLVSTSQPGKAAQGSWWACGILLIRIRESSLTPLLVPSLSTTVRIQGLPKNLAHLLRDTLLHSGCPVDLCVVWIKGQVGQSTGNWKEKRVEEESVDLCCIRVGVGRVVTQTCCQQPPTPLCSSFFFPSGELHIPSVCVTNLKPSFPGFDCLCVRSHKGGRGERKRTREEEGRGEGGWWRWMPVSLFPRPL